MSECSYCRAELLAPGKFCTACGRPQSANPKSDNPNPSQYWRQPLTADGPPLAAGEFGGSHHAAARGFAAIFGLHPALAVLAIAVDVMVSAVDVATLGVSAPILWFIAGIFTGVIVFLGQKKWYGDDPESAFIKAFIVAFLTALPTPLPSFLTVPSALVGTVQILRNKKEGN